MKDKKLRDEEKKAYHRDYYQRNKEKLLAKSNQYYKENTEAVKARSNQYYKMKMATDPLFKLTQYMRSRVRNAIHKNIGTKRDRTFELVGCSAEQLKLKLESQFTEGMTWENYGEWHVDHIRPCNSFDLSLDKEQKICFNYTNLQPLWAADNIRKSDNYE